MEELVMILLVLMGIVAYYAAIAIWELLRLLWRFAIWLTKPIRDEIALQCMIERERRKEEQIRQAHEQAIQDIDRIAALWLERQREAALKPDRRSGLRQSGAQSGHIYVRQAESVPDRRPGYACSLTGGNMNVIVLAFGWICDSLAYMSQLAIYTLNAVWVTIMLAAIDMLQAVDDWVPEFGIIDNALLRAVVMAVVGFFLGVVLMIFLAFIIGAWGIPCAFTLAIAFCAFVGLLADPERDWNFGNFPTFGRDSGPQTPLNL